jgi:tetratricopeptide (TPR) repeat protein/transglutaminase-like putative cysteine protease
MKPCRLWIACICLMSAISSVRADDWPVPRGPSREPVPYRYDAKVLKTIPKDVLDDSTACVIYSGTTNLIETDGTVEAISHEITRLNSRKGIEKLGEYRAITYDPTFEKLTLNEARIIKADGKIVLIEPKHVQLRDVATDFQVYDQSKQLVISFPNLEVGDTYEVKWTVRGKSREFAGHFFSRYTFGDDSQPVLRDEFRVRVPKNKTLKYATVNGKVDLKITDAADGAKFYYWSATDNRPLPRDEDRPSKEELRLQVVVSTFPTWEAVAEWKQKVREECWKCTPEVQKVIAEVTRDLKTPEEKAKALTYWVRRHVRYLSRGPGGLGYTPHLPAQVLSNLYGDCKDQAQLLAVMLREIGLPVWLVTLGTTDDGQVLPDVPSPWGSHAILLTQIDGKDFWIDTTVSLAAWDFLPRGDRDRQVYVTKDAELKLMKTPPFTYKDYRIEQETQVTIQPDGTARYRRDTTYHGSSAWSRRDKWLEVPPGERRRTAIAELQDAHTEAKLIALKIDEKRLSEFDKPVKAVLEFEVPRQFIGDAGSLSDSPVWTWLLGYNLDLERTLPYQLPTQFESIHRYVVNLPPAQRLETVPEDRTIMSPWGYFKLKVKQDADDPRKLEVTMNTRIEKVRVEKKDFDEFLRFHKAVSKAYRVWLALKPTTEIADAPSVEKYLDGLKTGDAQTAKILARLYLDNDRVEDARKLLDKATPLAADDKGLWDLRVSAAANIDEEERLHRAMVKQFPADGKYAVALAAVLVRRDEQAEAQKVLMPLLNENEPAAVRAAAHYQMARSLNKQKNPAAALKNLQSALVTDSGSLASMEALHFKARVHDTLGQTKDAIQTLLAALDADPNARDALEYIVRLELKADLKDAALEHLRRYTVAAGKDLSSVVKAADLHLEMNRLEDALELASRAREIGFQAKAQRILGLVHLAKQDYAQAAFHLERCDLDAKALAGLIDAQVRTGDLDAAQRRAESIKGMDNTGKELFAQGKDVARLIERRDRLLAQWKIDKEQEAAASRIVGRYVCAERGLAERWPHGQIDKLVESASADKLEYGPMLAVRGWLLLEKGQLRKAIAAADAAIKLQPSDARAFLVRGRARLEQANVQQALSDLRKATELSRREDAIVLHWFAAALLDAGRAKEAVETQRLALLLRPNDAELQDQLRRMEKTQPNNGAARGDE